MSRTAACRGGCLSALPVALLLTAPALRLAAQEDDTRSSYDYQRKIRTAAGSTQPRIVVCEFFTQGSVDPGGKNVKVVDNRHRPVPWRVLQLGPGDACRVAFQTVTGVHDYRIEYGGTPAGDAATSPEWAKGGPGLLLETRRWRACDLNRLESLREAFNAAEPMGADFVPSVFHRFNPTNPDPEPYLSKHTGTLHVDRPGRHLFFTSSQDASFLFIDGKQVVAWPGYHGPTGDTRFRGEVTLRSGPHAFEYLHGASGGDSCMVAGWQPPGGDKAEAIPPSSFGSNLIARLPTTELLHRGRRVGREFTYEVQGEAPVAESEQPLVRVRFRYVSYGGQTARPRVHWDFGDGQTSTAADPVHIYLHPGLYTVRLSTGAENDTAAVVNRVWVGRALEPDDKSHTPDTLGSYLAVIEKYDPSRLDPTGLLQLVRALQQVAPPALTAKLGQAGLLNGREKVEEISALLAVREIGSLLRDRLGDAEAARTFYQKAEKVLGNESWKAECDVEAADILLNDLLRPSDAKVVIDAATGRQGSIRTPSVASALERVRGDWSARQGDRPAALAAYARAAASRGDRRTVAEQEAWRGALSRSTEAFLREKQLDRAHAELRRWQDEFPADRAQGYLSLLQARLLTARAKPANAIAVATDLLAVNPDSPYADRILYLAADAEEQRNRPDQARARFQSLLNDYPGSPLVPDARARIAKIDAKPRPATPTTPAASPPSRPATPPASRPTTPK